MGDAWPCKAPPSKELQGIKGVDSVPCFAAVYLHKKCDMTSIAEGLSKCLGA